MTISWRFFQSKAAVWSLGLHGAGAWTHKHTNTSVHIPHAATLLHRTVSLLHFTDRHLKDVRDILVIKLRFGKKCAFWIDVCIVCVVRASASSLQPSSKFIWTKTKVLLLFFSPHVSSVRISRVCCSRPPAITHIKEHRMCQCNLFSGA